MTKSNRKASFEKLLEQVRGKRARIVVEHIKKHGAITTRDLRDQYGYDHPPRAIKDVTDQGVPIERKMISDANGHRMTEYRFGDPSQACADRVGGRQAFPKTFKRQMIESYGECCGLCNASFPGRALQIDHRIPYEIAGDAASAKLDVEHYLLLCGSCNRAKSWSCEQCKNWIVSKNASICDGCYWADPLTYTHVAMVELRRLDLTWTGDEIPDFETLRSQASKNGTALPLYVKALLRTRARGLE